MKNTETLSNDYVAAQESERKRVEREKLAPRGIKFRTVLMLGAGGYLGVPIAHHLLRRGYHVINVDMAVYGHQNAASSLLSEDGYQYVAADFANKSVIAELARQATDVVVLGGLVGDPITKKYPQEHQLVNERGVRDAIDACAGVGLNKLIFVSTCSNYGEIPEGALADEAYELKPLSLYAKAKVMQEQLLHDGEWDFDWTILRFSTAFGLAPRMRFDLTVNQFTRELYLGKDLEVYDPDTWRPYCHVRDFGRAIERVLSAPVDVVKNEVFNAGGDENNFTKAMIVEAICKQLPEAKFRLVSGGVDRRNYKVDFAKIRTRLHFEPQFSVEYGVSEILNALKDGYFADASENENFYGNYEVNYPIASTTTSGSA